jgi:hypothetical protein
LEEGPAKLPFQGQIIPAESSHFRIETGMVPGINQNGIRQNAIILNNTLILVIIIIIYIHTFNLKFKFIFSHVMCDVTCSFDVSHDLFT